MGPSIGARVAISLGVVPVILAAVAAGVSAHGTLITSTPMDQDIVDSTPVELVAVFSEPIDPVLSHMELLHASGATLAQGGDAPEDQSATTMRMTPPVLAPGRYEVRWSVVTPDDGFLERGSFSFSVAAAGLTAMPAASPTPGRAATPATSRSPLPGSSPSATADPVPPATPSDGAGHATLLPLVALGGLAAVVIALLASRRHRTATGS